MSTASSVMSSAASWLSTASTSHAGSTATARRVVVSPIR
jgi:hypothetical protein